MKYLSLDLETTCLQPCPGHILQFSCVVEDTELNGIPVEDLPHFACFIKQPRIAGEAYAFGVNGWILDYILGRVKNPPYPILSPAEWIVEAQEFIQRHFGVTKVTVASKNVAGFDIPLLPQEVKKNFRHKVLDPGPLFVDWNNDDQVPNFDNCKKRGGISGEVKHGAREDTMDVICLLRKFYV